MSLNCSLVTPKEMFICYLGKKEDHEVKFAHLYDMINDLEQYSRGNCLLFVSIKERDDEDMDVSAGCLQFRA